MTTTFIPAADAGLALAALEMATTAVARAMTVRRIDRLEDALWAPLFWNSKTHASSPPEHRVVSTR